MKTRDYGTLLVHYTISHHMPPSAASFIPGTRPKGPSLRGSAGLSCVSTWYTACSARPTSVKNRHHSNSLRHKYCPPTNYGSRLVTDVRKGLQTENHLAALHTKSCFYCYLFYLLSQWALWRKKTVHSCICNRLPAEQIVMFSNSKLC